MAITPRAPLLATGATSLLQAPRSLNEAVNCRFSNLRKTCAPMISDSVRDSTQGVSSTCPRRRAAARSMSSSSDHGRHCGRIRNIRVFTVPESSRSQNSALWSRSGSRSPSWRLFDGQAFRCRCVAAASRGHALPSPGLKEAPVLDLMCSHFVLTLAAKQGAQFNVRRDLNGLLSLAGRHLVWPAPVLARLREFLGRRCTGNEVWKGTRTSTAARSWSATASGAAPTKKARCSSTSTNTPRTSRRTCCPCCRSPRLADARAASKQSTLVEKNIDALAGLLQLNKAERALLLYGTLARYQRDLRSPAGRVQGQQRARGLCRHRRGGRRQRQRSRRGAARRLAAGAHRPGREPDLRAQHHRPGRPDEGQREAAAGADARVPRPERADGGVHAAVGQERAVACTISPSSQDDAQVLVPRCCATRWRARSRASTCCSTARPAPARPSWPRWWRRPPGSSCSRSSTPTATAIRCRAATATARCRSRRCSSRAARRRRCCSTRSKTCSRRSAPRPRSCMARAEQVPAPASGSVSGKAWVNQILESNAGAHDLGHQPHRADRPGVPAPLRLPPRAEVAAARRARAAGAQDAGRRDGVRSLRRQAGRAQGPDAGADPHRGALRRAGA